MNAIRKSTVPEVTYKIAIFILNLSGIIASVYLALAHYKNYTDINYQSFCAISKSLNCDTVAQSPYSIFLNLPIAVWGLAGYAIFLYVFSHSSLRKKPSQNYSALLLFAFLFSGVSIALAGISSFYIKSYCLVCFACYCINLCLFLVTYMAHKRFDNCSFTVGIKLFISEAKTASVQTFSFIFSVITITVLLISNYPKYWEFTTFENEKEALEQGITTEGYPWIGSSTPIVTIIEFSDYMCFQCGKMHENIRKIMKEHPKHIKLIHRQFPLDSAVNPITSEQIHKNSGLISLFALYALKNNVFWQVNDKLFQQARKKKINLKEIAQTSGIVDFRVEALLNDHLLHKKLTKDIVEGIKVGITATPTYLIDGELYSGSIPEKVLNKILTAP